MNAFDSSIMAYLSHFAFRAPYFDRFVQMLAHFYTTRGLMPIALLWWIWFRGGALQRRDRAIVIMTIASGFVGLFLGRALANNLPYRLRPLANPELGLSFPMVSNQFVRTWSAFPSDHAMLWVAVATGILLASRRLGIVALVYVCLFVCLPRVYLGLHHPTDVLAGGVLGAMVCLALNWSRLRDPITKPLLHWADIRPGLFYTGAFLLSFELVTQFEEVRLIVASFDLLIRKLI